MKAKKKQAQTQFITWTFEITNAKVPFLCLSSDTDIIVTSVKQSESIIKSLLFANEIETTHNAGVYNTEIN